MSGLIDEMESHEGDADGHAHDSHEEGGSIAADAVTDLDDDEPLEGQEFEVEDPAAESQPSRRERRAERGRLHTALQQEQAASAAMRERLARLEGQAQAQQQLRHDAPDPYQVAIAEVAKEIDANAIAARGVAQGTPEYEQFNKRWRALDNKKGKLFAQQALSESYQAQQAQHQQGAHAREVEGRSEAFRAAMQQQLEATFPDVYESNEAVEYARQAFLSDPTRQQSPGAAQVRSLEAARREFGMSGGIRPSESARGRYSNSGRGSARDHTPSRTSFTVRSEHTRLAEAMYPDLPKAQAVQKWVNTVGRTIMDEED